MKKNLVGSLLATGLLVSACAPQVDVHGYVPVAEEVASIVPGDSQESVLARLGQPTTKGIEGTNAWYYISSKVRRVAFFAPREFEREIVAISFNGTRVAQVERLGLEDGRLIDLNTNSTITDGRRLTFFEQLLGNIGNFSAETFIGGG
ncbi:MAG: outer membrane protein assembly factor BamE [Rhodobacteraceae bacterium]|nr:outer membrane protein assembly factor BamE [Paracoccaceae bacterium]